MKDQMRTMGVGVMAQPGSYSPTSVQGWTWAADNACFSDSWQADKWIGWLERMGSLEPPLFAVVPDVVSDAVETRLLYHEWAPIVTDLGYQPAFVAQNGATIASIPWDEITCLFIGGDTAWKLGHQARTLTEHAKSLGLWVHVGRVNSFERMQQIGSWGADSCDGTFLKYGPNRNLPQLARWLRSIGDTYDQGVLL